MEDKIKQICQKWDINEFSFFGSVNTNMFNSESDIDILLSFNDGVVVGFFELSDLKDELEKMLGRSVDIITKRGLDRSKNLIRKKSIINSSKLIVTKS